MLSQSLRNRLLRKRHQFLVFNQEGTVVEAEDERFPVADWVGTSIFDHILILNGLEDDIFGLSPHQSLIYPAIQIEVEGEGGIYDFEIYRLPEEKEQPSQWMLLITDGTNSYMEFQQLAQAKNQSQYHLELVRKQAETIRRKNEQLNQSLNYAGRLQRAFFPRLEPLRRSVSNCFVWHQPREQVGGDFYWYRRTEHYLYAAVADCTGHGVPGALLTVLGIQLLDRLELEDGPSTATCLSVLRQRLLHSLSEGEYGGQNGMDIALIRWEAASRRLQFAGAKRPVYIATPDGLETIKGSKMPCGPYPRQLTYENHERSLPHRHMVYLSSDGLVDQTNSDGEKFMESWWLNWVKSCWKQPMDQQERMLKQTFEQWKGPQCRQVDDVLIMGLHF
jgi:serine phosphatase RsbU (regulator of sigma subunit)